MNCRRTQEPEKTRADPSRSGRRTETASWRMLGGTRGLSLFQGSALAQASAHFNTEKDGD
jgi:hypothetical protein